MPAPGPLAPGAITLPSFLVLSGLANSPKLLNLEVCLHPARVFLLNSLTVIRVDCHIFSFSDSDTMVPPTPWWCSFDQVVGQGYQGHRRAYFNTEDVLWSGSGDGREH